MLLYIETLCGLAKCAAPFDRTNIWHCSRSLQGQMWSLTQKLIMSQYHNMCEQEEEFCCSFKLEVIPGSCCYRLQRQNVWRILYQHLHAAHHQKPVHRICCRAALVIWWPAHTHISTITPTDTLLMSHTEIKKKLPLQPESRDDSTNRGCQLCPLLPPECMSLTQLCYNSDLHTSSIEAGGV